MKLGSRCGGVEDAKVTTGLKITKIATTTAQTILNLTDLMTNRNSRELLGIQQSTRFEKFVANK